MTPIVAIYTAGYRYNFTKKTFEKTGILVIDSLPRRADVYLNDRLHGTTPARITTLLPQTYRIKVTKAGYSTWEQELIVESNLTTFSKNVVLFKKTLPVLTVDGQLNILAVAPGGELMIYSLINGDQEELWLHRLSTGTDFLITTLTHSSYDRLEFVEWSPTERRALLRQASGDVNLYLVISTETGQLSELFDVTPLSFERIGWDRLSDELLYGLRKSVLHQINLAARTVDSVASGNLNDFTISGKDMYAISVVGRQSFLSHTTIGAEPAVDEKIKLPSPSSYSLRPAPPGHVALLDIKNNDLFVIAISAFADQTIDDSTVLQADAKAISWSPDFRRLLFYTDFEIWIYDIERRQKTFVNRLGSVIEEALWYPKGNYILYRTANSLRATETENVAFKNDTELATLESISAPAVDSRGETIYFAGTVGNQAGLYQLTVQ